MSPVEFSVPGIGPGSQPEESDGARLEYLQMPEGMQTFVTPDLPEPEVAAQYPGALSLLEQLLQDLTHWIPGDANKVFDLAHLSVEERALIDQVLGEGEVGIRFDNPHDLRIQESVLAGVWRLQGLDETTGVVSDRIEIGSIPGPVRTLTFADAEQSLPQGEMDLPEGLLNGASILKELRLKLQERKPGEDPHVVNLSLLPHSPEDLEFLDKSLGSGRVTILSRGYGNCRIRSTATQGIWWVQFYNSTDVIILNTLEMCEVPVEACASEEDLQDSAQRLAEILEVYR